MRRRFAAIATSLLALTFAATPASADMAAVIKAYGRLLSKYVTSRGVKYDEWRASGADIKQLSEISMNFRSADLSALDLNERKALYINLYNATVLDLVLVANPRGSIKELSKGLNPSEIFSRDGLNFDQKRISLNDLEKRLRDESKDPRIHFAVNCAARSCPPLRAAPYTASSLDDQLDEATRAYLASPGAVEVRTDGGRTTILTSKLFDWYAGDFKASGGPLAFIQKYGPPEAAEAIAGGKAKLAFLDYDWGLNSAK